MFLFFYSYALFYLLHRGGSRILIKRGPEINDFGGCDCCVKTVQRNGKKILQNSYSFGGSGGAPKRRNSELLSLFNAFWWNFRDRMGTI